MISQVKELIFIYNADSTMFSKMTDFAHKIISPKTYQCNLCKLTYGNLNMHKDWEKFLKELNINIEFSYKDEFIKRNKDFAKHSFPLVLAKHVDNNLSIFVDSKEINEQKDLDDLKNLVIRKLK
jgi:hypothetical protein